MSRHTESSAPRWIRGAAAFFGLFALSIAAASLITPSMFDIDTSNGLQYGALITGSARNLGLAGLLLLVAWRARVSELWLALGLRSFVDLCDMVLSFFSPELNPIVIITAGVFACVAGYAAFSAYRLAEGSTDPVPAGP